MPASGGYQGRIVAALALLAGIGCASERPIANPGNRPDRVGDSSYSALGTYAVTFCKVKCDAGELDNVLVNGVIVLTDHRIDSTVIAAMMRAGSWITPRADLPEILTACFRLKRLGNWQRGGFVPRDAAGVFAWHVDAKTRVLHADVLTSPDATYSIEATVTPDGFAGVGKREGAFLQDVPQDAIVGRRMGPPNPAQCTVN